MKMKTYCFVALLTINSGASSFSQGVSTIQFDARIYRASEGAGLVTLNVQRTGDSNAVATVDYATVDGSATNGVKYSAVSGTLTFAAGDTNQPIHVPILDEGFVEGTQSFRVFLSNPTGGAVLGILTNVPVNISDNDTGIQFQFATNSIAEDAGAVLVGIVRQDDGTVPVTVDFFTTDLSAISGVDYVGLTTNLSFAADERLKLVAIPILNNSLKQPNRSFRVTLANPVGTSLGLGKTATVTIIDNDQGFQFESPSYSVTQDAGVVRLSVLRGTDDTSSAVSVDFAAVDGSATNEVDYIGVTNKLQFAPGDKLKLVSLTILNNGLTGPSKNFWVTLANPAGGAVLGSPTSASVRILNSDPGVGFEASAYTSTWSSTSNVTLTVLRGNPTDLGPISVDYATSNLTARAALDYQALSDTLQFKQGETVKSLTIPLLQTRGTPGSNSFLVTLSNPTAGATLGTASTAVFIDGSFVTLAPEFSTLLHITREQGMDIVTWDGGGQLQRADYPTGPWQNVANATSPYAVESSIPITYYRVSRPRPADVYVPSGYDGSTALPLVILLHHYSGTGAIAEGYWQLRPLAEQRRFLYCHPEGTVDRWRYQFWNATDACCDFWNTEVDDAGYLRALIEEIGKHFAVDPKRIYLIGRSNGGFMAYRMACQFADVIAGVAALAGVTFLDQSRCQPVCPVNILHIQGTGDDIIPYAGGALTTASSFPANMPQFPSALQLVQLWAGYNHSSGPVTDPAPTLDLTTDVPGMDTVVTRYTNCPPGGALELWTINGGTHFPTLSPQFSPAVIDWLLAHPKP